MQSKQLHNRLAFQKIPFHLVYHSCRACLYQSIDAAPTCWAIICPLLNIANVGMLNTLYFDANSLASSTLTLTKFTLPSNSFASSSTTGLTILQGPHHSAQKSTKTGCEEFITVVSQLFASDIFVISIIISVILL